MGKVVENVTFTFSREKMRQAMREILAWRAVISYRKCREVSAVWELAAQKCHFTFIYLFLSNNNDHVNVI